MNMPSVTLAHRPSRALLPALYMIPVVISEGTETEVLPAYATELVEAISYFAVENVRTARRMIRWMVPQKNIDDITFFEIGKHSPYATDYSPVLQPLQEGFPMAVLSEAGCPGVADPGADLVDCAQRKGFRVIPIVGPSSILLALMASGLNGQGFAFRGYLPKDTDALKKQIQEMEHRIRAHQETQIFIETPFRNQKLVSDLLRYVSPSVRLCIATDITGAEESIRTYPISYWKKHTPEIGKKPTIFLLG